MSLYCEIEKLIKEYKSLGISDELNAQEYSNLLISSHSTRIENSTLTLEESESLFLDNITPKGKNLMDTLMTKDHFAAFDFVMQEAKNRKQIDLPFLQEIASKVMKNTGNVITTALGTMDATKGDIRKVGVSAGTTRFMDYKKVIPSLEKLMLDLNHRLLNDKELQSKIETSYDAHYELVTIRPFIDGNGRTARLLMNFVQQYFGLPLSLVFAEDKQDYYTALRATRENKDKIYFYDFMNQQYIKFLQQEINSLD